MRNRYFICAGKTDRSVYPVHFYDLKVTYTFTFLEAMRAGVKLKRAGLCDWFDIVYIPDHFLVYQS